MLLIVWIHGTLGLYYMIKIKTWYSKVSGIFKFFVIVIPILALLGIYRASREVIYEIEKHNALDEILKVSNITDYQAHKNKIINYEIYTIGTYTFLIFSLFLIRFSYNKIRLKNHASDIHFADGTSIRIMKGMTILDGILLNGIPHAHVCGGRGRCTTCRIRIEKGMENLNKPGFDENSILHKISAPENVRLACQCQPTGQVKIHPLLPANISVQKVMGHNKLSHGEEVPITVLFADLRGFTALSEKELPFDIVFILNHYFYLMGTAIEKSGGHVDKFIGDGIMALFGIGKDQSIGCRNALNAAKAMSEQIDVINRNLAENLKSPLKIGIGIHTGPAIVGELGYGKIRNLTAIGDTVNTASRLESMTKKLNCQVILSEAVVQISGMDTSQFAKYRVKIRGRTEIMKIYAINSGKEIFYNGNNLAGLLPEK
jgi:adenylate cyclase